MRELIGLILYVQAFAVPESVAQTATRLADVHRVFLSFSAKPELAGVSRELARELKKTGEVTLVGSPAEADAVLAGDGDIFIKGYLSLNPRAGTSPSRGEPVRGGFLSVELKAKGNEALWSFLATPRFGSTHIEHDLSRQVVKQLLEALRSRRP